jgi:hypothetical protein
MAMMNCPECEKSVSDTAFKCPQCGAKLRKAKRSFFGKIIKWSFIAFNLVMAFWIYAGTKSASEGMAALDGAEQAGAAIGTGIGVALLLGIWVIGDIILGLFVLFTRPRAE